MAITISAYISEYLGAMLSKPSRSESISLPAPAGHR